MTFGFNSCKIDENFQSRYIRSFKFTCKLERQFKLLESDKFIERFAFLASVPHKLIFALI